MTVFARLSLVLTALMTLAAPAHAEPIPKSLDGIWQGTVVITTKAGPRRYPAELRHAQADPVTGQTFDGLELHWGGGRACSVWLEYAGYQVPDYRFNIVRASGGYCHSLLGEIISINTYPGGRYISYIFRMREKNREFTNLYNADLLLQ
jgi:hypothetical protein